MDSGIIPATRRVREVIEERKALAELERESRSRARLKAELERDRLDPPARSSSGAMYLVRVGVMGRARVRVRVRARVGVRVRARVRVGARVTDGADEHDRVQRAGQPPG